MLLSPHIPKLLIEYYSGAAKYMGQALILRPASQDIRDSMRAMHPGRYPWHLKQMFLLSSGLFIAKSSTSGGSNSLVEVTV